LKTNAERKPRIIEIMILVIYLFVMPLELKSNILMGRGVKKSHKSAKQSPKGKRRISIAFQGPPKAAGNCRILAFLKLLLRRGEETGMSEQRESKRGTCQNE